MRLLLVSIIVVSFFPSIFAFSPLSSISPPVLAWQATYVNSGSWSNNLLPVDVKLDPVGNAYVLALVGGVETQTNILLLKYSPLGQLLWQQQYDGGNAGSGVASLDVPVSLAFDSRGNVLVAGTSRGFSHRLNVPTYDDFVLIKYSSQGTRNWVRRFDGAAHLTDQVSGLVIDAQDNVYISGSSMNVLSNFDFVTRKYSPTGKLAWSSILDHGDWDVSSALAVDASGVYVTGNAGFLVPPHPNVYNRDFFTVKLDRVSGNVLWSARYDPGNGLPDYATQLVLDHAGNVIVSGNSVGNGNPDYATVKYDSSGNQRWASRYSGPSTGPIRDDIPFSLGVDSQNNVIVTGSSWNTSFSEIATVQYSGATGNQNWAVRTKGNSSNSYADIRDGLLIGPDDSVYIGGYAQNAQNNHDFLIEKYDSLGQRLWGFSHNGNGNSNDEVGSLALDPRGRLIVAGQGFLSPPPGYKGFIVQTYSQ